LILKFADALDGLFGGMLLASVGSILSQIIARFDDI
jgi:hypothetical protein